MKQMKKNLKMFVTCGVLFAATPLMADTETINGYTWTYRINGDTAEIYNRQYSAAISPSPTGALTIPSTLGGKPVTSIGQHAFRDFSGLVSVTMPDGVTSIEYQAFYNCLSLTSVTIPDGVTSIGGCAFCYCSSLMSVTIPDGVTSIEDDAFRGCSGLASVTIGNGVMSIGNSAFSGCSGLTSVTIPDSVTSIGSWAFSDCSGLASVTIGNGVMSIGNSAFSGCSGLVSFVVGDGNVNYSSVNSLLLSKDGKTLIRGVNGDVTIPDSVTSIGNSAFAWCSGLTSVTIPDSVTSIGSWAFSGCSGLVSFVVGDGNVNYSSVNSLLLSKDGKTLIRGVNGDVTIPDSVTSIGNSAFSGCSGLTSVTIGNGVTRIGSEAFRGCSGLTSVTIPDSVTDIGEWAFEYCSELTSVTIGNGVTRIGSEAFRGCSGLTSVTIPDSVTILGDDAFSGCSRLTSVTIPQVACSTTLSFVFPSSYQAITNLIVSGGVTNIGDSAFSGCGGLTSVTIPASVTSIGKDAFIDCTNVITLIASSVPYGMAKSQLMNVSIPDGVTSINNYAFYRCSSLTSVTIPNSVTSIGQYAFFGCSGLTRVTIPNSVTSIGEGAFWNCSGLTGVTMPDSVTSIGQYAFSGCSGLTRVTIPNSVTSIGQYAFSGCGGLTRVTIPNSVTSIGQYAFSGCSGLASVTIPDGVTSIERCAFSNCRGLTSVTIPDSVTNIGDEAFYNCSSLTGVTMPNSVTSIGFSAFSRCSGLTTVTISDSVTNIAWCAFSGCSGLASVTIPDSVTRIGSRAFQLCSGLTSVTIPDSVTDIGDNAFSGCSGLTNVTIPQVVCSSTLSSLFPDAYQEINDVVIADGVTSIGSSLFAGCTSLSHVTVPASVTSIGYDAFNGCSGLTNVTVPASVTSIGGRAFNGCTSLRSIVLPGWLKGRIDEASVFAGCSSGLEILYDDTIGIFVNAPALDIAEADQCDWNGDGAVSHDGVASARLNGRGLESTSSIELSVTGPGRLSFWWKASSEYDANADEVYDYGFLSIDGVAQGGIDGYKLYGTAIGGNTDWTNVVVDITGAGTHTVVWTYCKDDYDEIAGLADCIWLDEVVWTPFVSVEFASGGGSGTIPETVAGYSGDSFTLPSGEGLSRDGFLFGGWSDGNNVFPAGSPYVLGDSGVTLTAHWLSAADDSWRATFDLGGGTGTTPSTLAACPGEVIRLPGADGFSRDSHVFTGWSDGAAIYAPGAKYVMPVSGVTFTAQWFRLTRLAFALDGGVGVQDRLYSPGVTVQLPPAGIVSKAKHEFAAWSDGIAMYAGGASYAVPASDVVITALWTAKTIAVPTISSAQVANGGTADTAAVTVSISAEAGTTVHYTLDGSAPTAESPIYTVPLVLADFAVTVKAIAVRDDYFDSDVAAFSFTRKPYTLVDCLGLYGVKGVTVTAGGDGESWYRVEGAAAHDGVAGLRSGVITHNQTNLVEMAVEGPGTLTFWWKASSESIRGKPKDGLTFFADGERIGNMIGGTNLEWAQVSFEVVGDGLHVFRWAYSKDALDQAANIGEDCAWLDDVVWTPYGADPIPEIGTDVEVALALAGTTDAALVANVTNAAQYAAYRDWALSVTNAATTAQTIKESTRTWLSYAFAADALIDKELTSDDVKIESFTPASTDGKFEFTVSVKDVNIGGGSVAVESLKENLKKVLGIEGAATLSPGGFSSDNIDITFDAPVDGKAKFTVSPPADAGNSFFMRVRVK